LPDCDIEYLGVNPGFTVIGGFGMTSPTSSWLTDAQWAAYDTDAMVSMIPSTSNGFSLINFIIELKDFRRLAQAFINRRGRIAEILGVSVLKDIMTHPTRSLSSMYLNYSFNWKPFVSDLMSIYKSLTQTRKRLQDIWDRQNTPQTRHFQRYIDTTVGNVYGAYSYSANTSMGWVQTAMPPYNKPFTVNLYSRDRVRWTVPPVYHATMRFSYTCPGALGVLTEIDAYLDAFGVKLDASIIWNAIPFSFIIDWVIDVGSFLRRFSVNNLGLQVTVEDFCSSQRYKTVTEREIGVRRSYAGTDVFSAWINVAQRINERYERRVGIPNLYSALKTSGLSTKEASLGAALLLSNRRPRR